MLFFFIFSFSDQGVLDDLLPLTMFDFLQSLFMVVGALVIIGLANPWALLIIVPIVPAFLHLRRLFVTSRFAEMCILAPILCVAIFVH